MTSKAHLFLCIENGHYAVSTRRDGSNLPGDQCTAGWQFVRSIEVAANAPLPFAANPEPILRALNEDGYWLTRELGQTEGTSQ